MTTKKTEQPAGKKEPKELTITTMCMVGGKVLRVGEKHKILSIDKAGYMIEHGLVKKEYASI